MRNAIAFSVVAFVVGGACPTASFGQEQTPGFDQIEAASLLASAEFALPAEAAKLWEEDDGLPAPADTQFAREAAQFLARRPIPPPEKTTAAIRDVRHQRCFFNVKSEYAIICDRVLGKDEHQIDIFFHPAPIVTRKGAERFVRAVDLEIKPNGVVVTKERKHANVAIIPAQGESFEVLGLVGQQGDLGTFGHGCGGGD